MDDRPPERIPFQLTDDQINDLLEILDGVYCPTERIESFVAALEKGRDYFADQRLRELEEVFGSDRNPDEGLRRLLEDEEMGL